MTENLYMGGVSVEGVWVAQLELATPLPRAIRSSATRRVGGAHAPAAQACYGIGRQGCNTLVYVTARLEGGFTPHRLSSWGTKMRALSTRV